MVKSVNWMNDSIKTLTPIRVCLLYLARALECEYRIRWLLSFAIGFHLWAHSNPDLSWKRAIFTGNGMNDGIMWMEWLLICSTFHLNTMITMIKIPNKKHCQCYKVSDKIKSKILTEELSIITNGDCLNAKENQKEKANSIS